MTWKILPGLFHSHETAAPGSACIPCFLCVTFCFFPQRSLALFKRKRCSLPKAYVESVAFKKQFDTILQHDRLIFREPLGWQNKSIVESPLISDFVNIWGQVKLKYQTELSALAYRPIPDEESVAKSFTELIKRIE